MSLGIWRSSSPTQSASWQVETTGAAAALKAKEEEVAVVTASCQRLQAELETSKLEALTTGKELQATKQREEEAQEAKDVSAAALVALQSTLASLEITEGREAGENLWPV